MVTITDVRGPCQCGCGLLAPIASRTFNSRGIVKGQPVRFCVGHGGKPRGRRTTGYLQRHRPMNQRGSKSRIMKLHVFIVEQVLGRSLPDGAAVHHVDGNTLNNEHANLVVCENHAYHMMLHTRTRIVKAGGNPNTDHICSTCKLVKPREAFAARHSRAIGIQSTCRVCSAIFNKIHDANRRARRRNARV
jgi:HNH endonuclease